LAGNVTIDHRLLDGRAVRDRILGEVTTRVRDAAAKHVIGRLVSVSIGEHKAAAVYVRGQATAAKKVGLRFEEQVWPSGLTQDECKARIVKMNDDPDVLGVILQRPVPSHIHGRSLASAIHPFKDVEGMNPASIGNIVYNDLALAPCTAAASVELIKATGLNLHGLEVVMVGHSEIVGKPAAFMLMAEGATVTVCHHLTRSVAAHSRRADAVLVAVGKPKFLRADMVKPGAAVIDTARDRRDPAGDFFHRVSSSFRAVPAYGPSAKRSRYSAASGRAAAFPRSFCTRTMCRPSTGRTKVPLGLSRK